MRLFAGPLAVFLAIVLFLACSSSDPQALFDAVPDAGILGKLPVRPVDDKPEPANPDLAAAPELTSITPDKATVNAPDTTLVLAGKAFVPRSIVKLEGAALTTSFASATELRATVPTASLAAAGKKKISVSTPAPGGGTSNVVELSIENPAPQLMALKPLSVLTGSGATLLKLMGTGFVTGAKVFFGGTALDSTLTPEGVLQVQLTGAMLATSRNVEVKVVNPAPGGGDSVVLNFTISSPAATLTSVSPATATFGSATAVSITVQGTGFVNGSAIVFNGMTLPTTVNPGNKLTASVPPALLTTPAEVSVSVLNPPPPDGGILSNALPFQVAYPLPALTKAVTTAGASSSIVAGAGATEITVTGKNYYPVSVVTFAIGSANAAPATTTYVDPTHLKATLTPAQLAVAATVTVRVVNPGGVVSDDSQTITVKNGPPAITALTPSFVPVGAPDTEVVISGSGFLAGSTVRAQTTGSSGLSTMLTVVYVDGGTLKVNVTKNFFTAAGSTVTIKVTNPSSGSASASALLSVQCAPSGANVLLSDTQVHPIGLTAGLATSIARWEGAGGTCPNVALTPLTQPAWFFTVQNTTSKPMVLAAWATCAATDDAFLTLYDGGTRPADDTARKNCVGVVSEGDLGASPESNGSAFCPGLTVENKHGLKLAVCEQAVVHVQAFRAESPDHTAPAIVNVQAVPVPVPDAGP